MLRLRTFGGLALDPTTPLEGVAIRRRPLTLLALLAAAGERGMSRDKITAYLWPESDAEHARNSLSQALSALRRDLHSEQIVVGSAELRLNPDAIASDVDEFTRAIQQGRLEDAVALRTGPFLDGIFMKGSPELDHWIENERRRLHELYAGALARLANDATTRGDAPAAVQWSRRRVEATPLDGTAALALMQALAAAGDSTGALQHFRIHETLLRHELDAEPAAEVAQLAAQIRSAKASNGPSATSSTAAEPPSTPVVATGSLRRWWIGGGVAAAAALVSLAFVVFHGRETESLARATSREAITPADSSAAALTIRPETTPDNREVSRVLVGAITPVTRSPDSLYFDASISPDGNHVAYAGGVPGKMRIFVRPLAGTRAWLVSDGLPGNHRWPRWSADGSKIVFQMSQPSDPITRIYKVPAFGGSPESIIDSGTWPSWARDGRLAYANGGIWILPANGGGARRIDSTRNAVWPSWSPDGKRIVFAADDQFYLGSNYGGVVKNPVWVIDADGRHKRKLYAADALHAAPVWSPDGRSILFVSDRDGAHDVYRQEIGDSLIGPLQRVTVGANVYTFSLSANGSRMAYNSLHFDEGTNIWAAPIGETTTPFSAARPVTRGRQEIKGFSISHDGRWLAFDSDRDADGYVHIYKVALDGRRVRGDPIRLTHQHADDGDPQWAPGDSEIVFYRKAGEYRNVYVIRADGRREMRVTTDTMLNEYHPDWSSDGRTVVYTAHLRTDDDRYHVFIATRDAKGRWGEPTELLGPSSAGAVARWAPMGDQIVQWPGTLRVLDAKTGSVREYLTNADLGERISASYWGGDTAAIYLRSVDSNRVASFWKYDLRTETPRRVLTLADSSRTNRHQFFDVSGQTLFFTISPAGSEVFVAALTWR